MTRDSILQHALALSPDERMQLADELFESVYGSNTCPELSPAQRADLLRRLDDARANPDDVLSWDEAERQILNGR